ncbi:TetR/AcrR family transcriptional regulator [Haloechinothrix sp. YIM 98757]|uniref:TetR/AcrR family transcriptional regulator n=1 Tax=Haloechinothrix aidingensis TaxID=2752311 RepID=A0A838A896_9PSEU|nr:TetR/AcrR family transcriptional regulator [Haloechinothrix aidingensis]MBA0124512.1 TetR/AcrR family transcriptional regulator [Haloechinothrix aidingensis]
MAETEPPGAPEGSRLGPDERRDQILACARRLFSEHGIDGVSNADVARAAGVSRALLNHYFGSRRELYREVVRRMMDVPPVPVPEYVPGASVEDRVAQSLDGWLELLSRNRSIWLDAIGIAGCGGDEELEAIIDQARDRAVNRAVEVTGLGPVVRAHPEIHAVLRGFSGMAEATTREWLRHGRLTRKQVHTLLEHTLLTIIRDVVPEVTALGE